MDPPLPFSTEDGVLVNSGEFSGLTADEALKKMAEFAEKKGFGKPTITFRSEGLGRVPPAVLGHADPDDLLRERRHRAGAGEQICRCCCRSRSRSRSRVARRWRSVPEFVNMTCPEVRRAGAARDGHDGHVRRFVLVLLPLHRSRRMTRLRLIRDGGVLVSRSTSTSAAWSTRFCT